MWGYNYAYFTTQGARFASVMAFLPMLTRLPFADLNYLYHQGLIFSTPDQEYLNRNYELDLPAEKWAGIIARLEAAVQRGEFSAQSLATMEALYDFSRQVKSHYLDYPEAPEGLADWSQTACRYWGY
jgi:hypothetical protein